MFALRSRTGEYVGLRATAAARTLAIKENPMIARQILIIAGCMFVSWMCPDLASAQVESTEATATAKPTPSARLTPEQLEAFSDLSGDGQSLVASRLSTNPRLVPLAAAAANARMSRRSTGKAMAIVGFTILGVGDIVGGAIIASTPGYPNVQPGHGNRILLGVGVGVVSLGVGLALAIPGLIKMASPSDIENRALDYYAPGRREVEVSVQVAPVPAPVPAQVTVMGKTVTSPLLSVAF
jgi:hypothetical protein